MKTFNLNEFVSLYHNKMEPKGIRLGQALSTTFIKPTDVVCEIAAEQCNSSAVDIFVTMLCHVQWDLNALVVVDDSMLLLE